LKSVCVYCGSSVGNDPAYAEAARATGTALAAAGVRLVYGGGAVGLMGIVADAALGAGGEVVGVIPRDLFKAEVAHPGLTELVEVGSMHERKMGMFERSDAFVALPGGLGTLEELTETATWALIGVHEKPIVTLDVGGYWRPLHDLLNEFVRRGFLTRSPIGNVTEVSLILPVILGPG
jgi:uncharacterized protein (TIGR00730 family)